MGLKTSKASRFSKILGIGASVVGKSISATLTLKSELETRIEQAKAIADGLAELKGASMKLGQMLAIQGEHYFPPAVTEVLSKLQNSAPALSVDEITALIKRELGPKFSDIVEIEPKPIGAASIGQVHRARLKDGTQCALKVQYPGVAEAIDSEIDLLKKILTPIAKAYIGKLEVEEIVNEVKTILKQEVNYSAELKYLAAFRELLRDRTEFIVPQPFPEYSTPRLLTMSYEEGISFRELVKLPLSQQERNKVGSWIFELLLWEIYDARMVQTDPNFGNYLFRLSPDNTKVEKVVLLDFGASKVFSEKFTKKYSLFAKSIRFKNYDETLKLADELKLLSKDENEETKKIFFEMLEKSVEPLGDDQPYDFGKSQLPMQIANIGFQLVKSVRKTSPPAELMFLNRKLAGVYTFLKLLGVVADFRELTDRYYN